MLKLTEGHVGGGRGGLSKMLRRNGVPGEREERRTGERDMILEGRRE